MQNSLIELFQFLIIPKGSMKPIKLQLPIMIATYPLKNKDGTIPRRKGTYFPSTLPVFRPWLNGSTTKINK